jgi:uncharacterized protein (TIGR02271 family)
MITSETIVAVYDRNIDIDTITHELESAGVPASSIKPYSRSFEIAGAVEETSLVRETTGHRSGFWSWLVGDETPADTGRITYDSATAYDNALAHGATVLTVIVDAPHVEPALSILWGHAPRDLQEYAPGSQDAGLATPATPAPLTETGMTSAGMLSTQATTAPGERSEGQRLQLAEERIQVGKREVAGGTTRLRRYVVSRPVEEQILLRDEKVTVRRLPASGAAVAADAFTEKTIEVSETREEPVVTKIARVIGEVALTKEVTERTETVRDTVRREEIEVEGPGNDRTTRRVEESVGHI